MKPAIPLGVLVVLILSTAARAEPAPWEVGRLTPSWSAARPRKTTRLDYKPGDSETDNGARLQKAIGKLKAGDLLLLGSGRWSIAKKTSINLVGSAAAPIRIVGADPRRPPVITRPDGKQNVLNIGETQARYLVLRNLIVTGGSSLIRLYHCSHVWIDRCELTKGGNVGITANVHDTDHLWITRNQIHHLEAPKATCEGMYLGANHGKAVMSYSVIAGNHVHHMGGTQGDGIEVKQGSHHNWIVGNHVHDTRYPCIIAYGTAGNGINVIERNLCYRSGDNVMQVQGEAIVRNNLLIAGTQAAFASTDHQGKTRRLTVVHNTLINAGTGARLSSWDGREGMSFANNAVYSQGDAIRFPRGSKGVTLAGNVVFGNAPREGCHVSRGGLVDVRDAAWDGSRRDARPRPRSALHQRAHARFLVKRDLSGALRKGRRTAGAFDARAKTAEPAAGRR